MEIKTSELKKGKGCKVKFRGMPDIFPAVYLGKSKINPLYRDVLVNGLLFTDTGKEESTCKIVPNELEG